MAGPPEGRVRQILHLDMDAFFVAVEELRDPGLKGKPVVVGGSADSRGVVAAASYAARRYGIRSAMPMARALALCPGLIRVSGGHGHYSEYSRKVFRILRDFTPWVEPTSIDEGYLDLTGFESLYGDLILTAGRIHERIRSELGLECSLGLSTSRMVSKVASELAKPRGLIAVFPGREAAFLAPLPVRRLPGVGPQAEEKLRRLGIRRLGEIPSLGERRLAAHFGVWGPELWRRAQGIDETPVSAEAGDPRSVGAETTFPRDLESPRALRIHLRRLVEKAARRMRRDGLACRCVTVKLRAADFTTTSAAASVPRPTTVDAQIFRLAVPLLDKLWRRHFPVRLVGVRLSSLSAPGGEQPLLFERPDRGARLMEWVDKVHERFGSTSLTSGLEASASGEEEVEEGGESEAGEGG